MKKYRTLIIIVLVVLLAVAAFLIIRQNRLNANASTYETAVIERGTLTATIGATGNVRSNQSAMLTWQTTGMVGTVHVVSGDEVNSGDVLAEVDPATLPQGLLLAQADLVTARLNLENVTTSRTAAIQAELNLYQAEDALDAAEYRYDIAKGTYGEDSTERAFLEAKAGLALAQARVEDAQRAYDRVKDGPNADDIAAAQARVDAAEAALRAMKITAPFDGTITETFSAEGDQVTMGARGFRIDDLSRMLIDIEVTEVDINGIEIGQPAVITFDAVLDVEYHGEVVDVAQAGEISAGGVNFTVTIAVTDADELVKPGMTAAVMITVKQLDDVMLVPNRAVRLLEGERVVFVQTDLGVEKVVITLGASSNLVSEVIGGDLEVGDVIILNPSSTLIYTTTGVGGPPFMGR